uniref:Pectinesterase n=1 Tax=Nelumbo nucifera TaxID=4432 RepID=A0A822YXJ3_NELNU|nr:TPA_asm: hypothetical protein HUJ06_012819 [Nelumbo nucifera]
MHVINLCQFSGTGKRKLTIKAMGKLIALGISLLLVVGTAINTAVGHDTDGFSAGDIAKKAMSSTAMKNVKAICALTDFEDACIKTLTPVANNKSATPEDYLKAAFEATNGEVEAALEKSGVIGKDAQGSIDKMAVEDCKELLQFAIDDLQSAISMAGDPEKNKAADVTAEFKNWLSAVVSYQESCIDGFEHPELKNSMQNGLLNATQLTSNALTIIGQMSSILKALNINFDFNIKSRRRLLDAQGYPTWFAPTDRKLLALQDNGRVAPNAVVAKDGSGHYKTIAEALAAYPKKKGSQKNDSSTSRYVIYVKAGTYDEYITITKDQTNILMYGDGPRRTIVTGHKSNREGISTFQTASFSVIGDGFICRSMGFHNTAGPEGHQAVALRVQSDRAAFFNCRMDGYQDTLYVQAHRQFYRNCVISGTIDFIFGDSSTVIQNSLIIVRRPLDNQQNTVTAQGKKFKDESTGLVLQNCKIVPEQRLVAERLKIPSYLGRPWKEYAVTVIMESTIGDVIRPEGWMPWAGDFALDTLFYAEYNNRGPGANTDHRVKWKGFKVITKKDEALRYTVGPFIQGDEWLKDTGSPFTLGLRY